MGISEDGNVDEENDRSGDEATNFSQMKEDSPQSSYVSVLDPVGEPAFKPSTTKPLPKWMSLLPTNVHRDRGRRQKAKSSEIHLRTNEIERLNSRSTSIFYSCVSELDPEDPPAPPPTTEATPVPLNTPDASRAAYNSRMTISIDLGREGAVNDIDDQESTFTSRSDAPPETRFPPRRPSMPSRGDTTSYFSHGLAKYRIADSVEGPFCDLETASSSLETPSSNASSTTVNADSSSPYWVVQSSEYLERYQPKSAESKYKRYVAKEREPVLERIKKQRVGKREAREEMDNDEKRIKLNEEFGQDSKREDLNRELRNLFCGD
jgi:hypothetical protein